MFSIIGLHIYSGSMQEVVNVVGMWLTGRRHRYICVTGAHGLLESRNRKVFNAHAAADMVVPDGVPLVCLGRLSGHTNAQRIYGPDLFLAVNAVCEKHNKGIYLYGSTEETLSVLRGTLNGLYPGLRICGSYSPPFRELTTDEERRVISDINKENPAVIWVGLGTPKQEVWMYRMRKRLNANLLVGVGAAFDYIAGTKKQAPRWMRNSGLEWLFRLITEPRRLWKRYTMIICFLPSYLAAQTILAFGKRHHKSYSHGT